MKESQKNLNKNHYKNLYKRKNQQQTQTEKHALGNTLSRVVDVPLRVGEVRFLQYVQSRPRRFGGGVVVDGGERFYCGLKDSHVPKDSLPLLECSNCPNVNCRELVFGEVKKLE